SRSADADSRQGVGRACDVFRSGPCWRDHALSRRPMSLPRAIEPEWLDRLPGEDPEAQASRRDLRRLNALMLHSRIVAGAILAQGLSETLNGIAIRAGGG